MNILDDALLNISTTDVPPYCNSIVEYPDVLTTNLLDGVVVPIPTLPLATKSP